MREIREKAYEEIEAEFGGDVTVAEIKSCAAEYTATEIENIGSKASCGSSSQLKHTVDRWG